MDCLEPLRALVDNDPPGAPQQLVKFFRARALLAARAAGEERSTLNGRESPVSLVKDNNRMTPQHNDVNKPPTRTARSRGLLPIILAAAAIMVGVWYYTGRETPNPVTGRDAPASSPAPSR